MALFGLRMIMDEWYIHSALVGASQRLRFFFFRFFFFSFLFSFQVCMVKMLTDGWRACGLALFDKEYMSLLNDTTEKSNAEE